MTNSIFARPATLGLCALFTLTCLAACNKPADEKSPPPATASAGAPNLTAAAAPKITGMPNIKLAPGLTATITPVGANATNVTAANFKVEGMTCAECCAAITQNLSKINGVKSVSADWKAGAVNVSYEKDKVQPEQLTTAIEELKYKVTGTQAAVSANTPAITGVSGAQASAAGAMQCPYTGAQASDPASFVIASTKLPNGHVAATYHLSGMTCADCEKKVTTALTTVKGVDSVKTAAKDSTVVVTYDPAQATPAAVLASLKATGFGVLTADGKGAPATGGCPAGAACPAGKAKDSCTGDCCKDKAAAGKDAKTKTGGDKPKPGAKGSHA